MPVYTMFWRNKFLPDADTFDELVRVFQDAIEELRTMKEAGVEFERLGDDYYLLSTEDPEIAERFGFNEETDEGDENFHDCLWEPEYGGEG